MTLDYVYLLKDTMFVILDDSIYTNHSTSPNSAVVEDAKSPDFGSSYATRDIKKGEEWFEDYGDYDHPPWYVELMHQYKCDLGYFEMKKKN